ncbi:hypothetical protein B0H34DRAFT_410077 [Crassisporium funariophilum]|nr:hypothetical protein B0H34DRAFT_410077 [Crassisporium funariophilum]
MSEISIQLPSSLAAEETADRATCGICRRQFAKYTCPTCNVPYCSLTCFRSQAHNQCSETFYKKELESDIHTEPSKNAQERQQMMDLLERFEEESAADQALLEGDEAGEEAASDLERRFAEIDLDSTSPDALWSMLTAEERAKFMQAFDDPSSELAQQLLASESLETDIQKPWWEASSESDESDDDDSETEEKQSPARRRHGARPRMMRIPLSMVKPVQKVHPLMYNICAVCVAYAYITRHLGTSALCSLVPEVPEYAEARRLVSQLVPFLTDRKSTTLYPNLSAVITDIWSLFDLGKMTSDLFSLLLRDSAHLLEPLRVTELTHPSPNSTENENEVPASHPHIMPVLVLSDLIDLFSTGPRTRGSVRDEESESRSKDNHVTHKLLFYAAQILSTPSVILQSLVGEMRDRSKHYQMEGVKEKQLGATIVERKADKRSRKLVEEM